jgi:hypothetical protein
MSVCLQVVQDRAMPTTRTAAEVAHPGAPLPAFERFVEEDGGGALLATGHWGLEREVLRIEADGQPARTPHPFPPEEKGVLEDFVGAAFPQKRGERFTDGIATMAKVGECIMPVRSLFARVTSGGDLAVGDTGLRRTEVGLAVA